MVKAVPSLEAAHGGPLPHGCAGRGHHLRLEVRVGLWWEKATHSFTSRPKAADGKGARKSEWSRTPGQGWDSAACTGATAISE